MMPKSWGKAVLGCVCGCVEEKELQRISLFLFFILPPRPPQLVALCPLCTKVAIFFLAFMVLRGDMAEERDKFQYSRPRYSTQQPETPLSPADTRRNFFGLVFIRQVVTFEFFFVICIPTRRRICLVGIVVAMMDVVIKFESK